MAIHRRSILTGLIGASLCPICLAHGAPPDEYESSDPAWDYGRGPNGQANWGKLSPKFYACGKGDQQSPIMLSKGRPEALPPLKIQWSAAVASVSNNGHTILVVPKTDGSTVAEGGGPVYVLKEFHFHRRSEHTIDGRQYAMEVHFVHRNDIEAAVTVVGVLVEPGPSMNDELQKIWDSVPKQGAGRPIAINPDPTIDPSGLLPVAPGRPIGRRFRYAGSLTTPGCAQIVNWHVLEDPLLVSQAQIDAFDKWYRHNARDAEKPGPQRVVAYG